MPVRHGRMMVSPFTFYRGAAKIMAADLKDTPTAGLNVQLCGDAHLSNFGGFASPERVLLFDLNDFDETLPGPFEYDVKRMAASFTIAARNNGFTDAEAQAASLASASAYREAMLRFAEMGTMEIWYSRVSAQDVLDAVNAAARSLKGADKKRAKTIQKTAIKSTEKARTRDSTQALSKLAEHVDGRYRIISQPPVIVPSRDLPASYGYSVQEIEHIGPRAVPRLPGHPAATINVTCWNASKSSTWPARSSASAASARGPSSCCCRAVTSRTRCSCRSRKRRASVLEDHLPKSRYRQPGERVVQGQRMMQAASDIYLGWTKGAEDNRYLYWRQLRDMKVSADVETMATGRRSPRTPASAATTLARAHARSGDPVAIAAYLGKKDRFDQSIADFSERYADQNEQDYQAFRDAIRTGRLQAIEGA